MGKDYLYYDDEDIWHLVPKKKRSSPQNLTPEIRDKSRTDGAKRLSKAWKEVRSRKQEDRF